MAKTTYRLTPFLRLVNMVTKTLLRLGIPIDTTSPVSVRGRKSSQSLYRKTKSSREKKRRR